MTTIHVTVLNTMDLLPMKMRKKTMEERIRKAIRYFNKRGSLKSKSRLSNVLFREGGHTLCTKTMLENNRVQYSFQEFDILFFKEDSESTGPITYLIEPHVHKNTTKI